MAPPSTPWSKCVCEHLSDGHWHRFEDVILEAMRLVPPGEASREGIYQREKSHKTKQRQRNRPDLPRQANDTDYAKLIVVGSRAKVYAAIVNMTRSGTLERSEINGQKMIRQAPAQRSNMVPFQPRAKWGTVVPFPGTGTE